MREVFADSVYWIALTNPEDQGHRKAAAAEEHLQDARLVTTEDVLVEFLTYFGAYGSRKRQAAAMVARAILEDSDVAVVSHTSETFLEGLELYEARLDKHYSMVDCMSMQVMRRRELTEVLTHDHHFAQEGCTVLL